MVMLPWPMLYPKTTEPAPESRSIVVTVCSLCAAEFPDWDVIVASCQHLYHPWCALIVFGKANKCVHEDCPGSVNSNWCKSFGWAPPAEETLSDKDDTIEPMDTSSFNVGE
jgi:hypothetical protein